jgi:hypothetical protein
MNQPQPEIEGIKLLQADDAPVPDGLESEPIPRIIDSPNVVISGFSLSRVSFKEDASILQSFLPNSASLYRGYCECGTTYDNNCAHFLTDAMVRAGLPKPFPTGVAKCPSGRMIRAKETLAWFRTFSSGFNNNHGNLSSGYWFVYQESNGQGHVCIHQETSNSWYWWGTGDYPNWPVQWHYYYCKDSGHAKSSQTHAV